MTLELDEKQLTRLPRMRVKVNFQAARAVEVFPTNVAHVPLTTPLVAWSALLLTRPHSQIFRPNGYVR
jgi:hypothetical protein